VELKPERLKAPVLPPDRYWAKPLIDRTDAETRLRKAIADIAHAKLEKPVALLIPFWSFELERLDDVMSDFTANGVRVPYGVDERFKRVSSVVCARTRFPHTYDSFSIDLAGVEIGDPNLEGWDVIDADIDEKRATEIAFDRAQPRRSHQITHTRFKVHTCHFVRQPVWLAACEHRGEMSDGLPFHVAISAVGGSVISAHTPSQARALWEKVRGFVLRDRAPEPTREKTDLEKRFAEYIDRNRTKR
jgi:hypothetical protein